MSESQPKPEPVSLEQKVKKILQIPLLTNSTVLLIAMAANNKEIATSEQMLEMTRLSFPEIIEALNSLRVAKINIASTNNALLLDKDYVDELSKRN
jgi:hypothetical protein